MYGRRVGFCGSALSSESLVGILSEKYSGKASGILLSLNS
jgi:hypothetical protein